jgi:hypothetical protein
MRMPARSDVCIALVAAAPTIACPLRHFGDHGGPSIQLWAQVAATPPSVCTHRTLAELPDVYGLAADTTGGWSVLTFVLGQNIAHARLRLDSIDAAGRPVVIGGFTLTSFDHQREAEEAAKRVLLTIARDCAGARVAPEVRCEYSEYGSAERRCPTERLPPNKGLLQTGVSRALPSLAWQVLL